MVGVWPGMRMINVPLPAETIRCADSARGIRRAVASGAAVINMSYGSTSFCQREAAWHARGRDVGGVAPTLQAAEAQRLRRGFQSSIARRKRDREKQSRLA